MAANDNAMTRFLFAILQQKCLKDIDWNKVAHDPILAQEITNGHAARMRYSRFRAQLLGLEPQKRKRDPNRTRVTKKKKDEKPSGPGSLKRDNDDDTDGPPVKRERTEHEAISGPHEMTAHHMLSSSLSNTIEAGADRVSPKIKAEPGSQFASQHGSVYPRARPSSSSPAPSSILSIPVTCPSPSMPDLQAQFQARLLTPCSDSDAAALAHSQGFGGPGSDMFSPHAEPALDFGSPATHVHDAALWQGVTSPQFGGFTMNGFGLDNYAVAFGGGQSTPGIDEHHHQHIHQHGTQHPHGHRYHHSLPSRSHGHAAAQYGQSQGEHRHMSQRADDHMEVAVSLMDQDSNPVVIKHEEWDMQRRRPY